MPTNVATRTATITDSPVSFTDDFAWFRRVYKLAQAARDAGSNPMLSFMVDPTSAPVVNTESDGYMGLMFGIELEFNAASHSYFDESTFGQWMFDNGYTASAVQRSYHSGYGETRKWRFEDDCSVSGGEVISPILKDDVASWSALHSIVEQINAHNGSANGMSAGAHIHIDSSDMGQDAQVWQRLFIMIHAFEDVLYRLAANPFREGNFQARHRGNGYCRLGSPSAELRSATPNLGRMISNYAYHTSMINTENVSQNYGSGHFELRLWDATLDMPLIQAHVKISAALRDAALNPDLHDRIMALEFEPRGTHRTRRREWAREAGVERGGAYMRLSGEQWREDTASFRTFCDLLFTERSDKEQMATLFALNRKWASRH